MNQGRKKIDWLNHSLEFFVVIIGILIAFQLNKCSSDNAQRKTIDIHISQIVEETEFNKKAIERAISFTESNLLKLDTVAQLIQIDEDYHTVNRLSLELLNLGGSYIRKNAYQTLVESGDIRLMKDFNEKNRIINLYEYYKWVESFNDISSNLFTSDYYPYLKDNLDLVNGTLQPKEVYQSKLFRNLIGAYSRTSQNRLGKYKECLKEINDFLQDVE